VKTLAYYNLHCKALHLAFRLDKSV